MLLLPPVHLTFAFVNVLGSERIYWQVEWEGRAQSHWANELS